MTAADFPDFDAVRARRKRFTKGELLAELDAADGAWMDIETMRHMAEAYYASLEKHLRAHGCVHDFGDVAERPEEVA